MEKKEQTVTLQQLKDALLKEAGQKFPIKIIQTDGEELVRYIRGFADQQQNILLISETSFSLAMKILELKDISRIEYAIENSGGAWKVLHVKGAKKAAKT